MLSTHFDKEKLVIASRENGGNVNYDYDFFKEGFEDWAAELDIEIADIDDLIRYITECGYNVIDIYYKEEEKKMLNITRGNRFYRPYVTNVNGVERYVDKIYIYNKEGIILKINQGWLEDKQGKDIRNLELNTNKEIILRRKEKFDGEIYIMNTASPYTGEKRVILYIPNELIDFKKVRRYLNFNYTVVDVWESDIINSKYEVWRNEFRLNDKLYQLEKQFKELKEDYNFKLDSNMNDYIEKFKNLKKEYEAHIEWIESLNINEL